MVMLNACWKRQKYENLTNQQKIITKSWLICVPLLNSVKITAVVQICEIYNYCMMMLRVNYLVFQVVLILPHQKVFAFMKYTICYNLQNLHGRQAEIVFK